MTGVLLDIGAGTTGFARLFCRFNPTYKLQYPCGEPHWTRRWNGKVRAGAIKKIGASYHTFNVPDASLHFVTLNAYHPFTPPFGIEEELIRALIPAGGVFISAHPVGLHPTLSEEYFYAVQFEEAGEYLEYAIFGDVLGIWRIPVCVMKVDRLPTLYYPASWTIRTRIRELQLPPDLRHNGSSYVYAQCDRGPSVAVWIRNEKPA